MLDAPDAQSACTRRVRSTTPLQALTLLNDTAYVELAQALAARIGEEGSTEKEQGIEEMFRLCLGRTPQPSEAAIVSELLEKEQNAWPAVARAMLNLDEFITRE